MELERWVRGNYRVLSTSSLSSLNVRFSTRVQTRHSFLLRLAHRMQAHDAFDLVPSITIKLLNTNVSLNHRGCIAQFTPRRTRVLL